MSLPGHKISTFHLHRIFKLLLMSVTWRKKETEGAPICWFTFHMPSMAGAEPGTRLGPRNSVRSSTWWQEAITAASQGLHWLETGDRSQEPGIGSRPSGVGHGHLDRLSKPRSPPRSSLPAMPSLYRKRGGGAEDMWFLLPSDNVPLRILSTSELTGTPGSHCQAEATWPFLQNPGVKRL